MDRKQSVVTPERFASGMTFEQYVRYVGTPENLKREGSGGAARKDWSGYLRTAHESARLSEPQVAAWKWLAARPDGPAKVLVIAEEPDGNADLMAEFLNEKNGQTWQSIPVAAFYTRSLEYLYHYTEYPAIYHKDRLLGHVRSPRPGESAEAAKTRAEREFVELQQSPFFRIWACAGVDEILTGLHERLIVGSLA